MKSNYRKKASLLVLSFVLMAALALTGCSGKSGNTPSATSSPSAKAKESPTASAPAAAELEHVELNWYFPGGTQTDIASVEAELNKVLKEKINATLHLNPIEWGDYEQKMQLLNASGEKYDLAFTANWFNNYYQNVNKGAFIPLNDLLDKYAPGIMETIPAMGWDALKVNGSIYAVPNYQVWTMTNGVTVQKDLAASYGFDPVSIKKLEDLQPFLEQVKTKNPEKIPFAMSKGGLFGGITVSYGFDEIAGRNVPGVIRLEDDSLTVLNQFESEEYKGLVELMRSWYQSGYIRKDAATLADGSSDHKAGKHASLITGNVKPGSEVEALASNGGIPVVDVPVSKSYLLTSSIIATMTGISKTSEHPERALMLLNLMFTDKEVFNLVAHGIEGKHYNKLDEVTVEAIPDSGYNPNSDWLFGNQFMGFYRKGQPAGTYEATLEMNNSATPSPLIGFTFDPTPVKTEMAQVATVTEQYIAMLETGSVDVDKYLPEFIDKLKKAGSDKIIAEQQKQIDAWKQTKG